MRLAMGAPRLKVVRIASSLSYVIITTAILLYPFRIFSGFSQLDGLQVVINPSLFAFLMAAWVFSYVVCLSYTPAGRSAWVAALIASMAIGFSILAYKMAPLGVDHSYSLTLTDTTYLAQQHRFGVPPPPNVGYLGYPGIALLFSATTMIVGASDVSLMFVVQASFYVATALALYKVTELVRVRPAIAGLVVPLFFTASLEGGNFLLFFPAEFGVVLFALMVMVLVLQPTDSRWLLTLYILGIASTFTHFYDPVDFLALGTFLLLFVPAWRQSRRFLFFIFAFATIYASYFGFFAVDYFSSVVRGSIQTLSNLLNSGGTSYALQVINTNSVGIPFWAVVTRYVDIGLTSIIGLVVGFAYFVRRLVGKHSSHPDLITTYFIASVGVMAFGIVAFLASLGPGGGFNLLIGPRTTELK